MTHRAAPVASAIVTPHAGSGTGRMRRTRMGRAALAGSTVAVVMTAVTACAAPSTPAAAPMAPTSSVVTALSPPGSAAPTNRSPAGSSTAGSLSPVSPTSGPPPSAPTTAAPTDFGSAECYFTAGALGEPMTPDIGVGVAFGFKEGTQDSGEPYDNTLTTESYLDVCRQSLARDGRDPGTPALTACVLTDGRIAVAPGDESICGARGLPVAQPSASGPIPSS